MTSTVSVIIPVWNVEKYLSGCLYSVLGQTYQNLEIICVNDGSPDHSAEILAQFAASDQRIKIITQKNQGLSAARNTGISAASGEYIFFLDSDDYLHPQAIEILVSVAQKTGSELTICNFQETKAVYEPIKPDKTLTEIKYHILDHPLDLYLKRDKRVTCTVWNRLYHKKLLTDLRFINGIVFEDVPFTSCLLPMLDKVAYIPENLCYYFVGSTSITRSSFNIHKLKSYVTGLQSIFEYYQHHYPEKLPQIKTFLFSWHIRVLINSFRKSESKVRQELRPEMKNSLRMLYRRHIISFRGLSWGKKLDLFCLLYL